MSGTFCDSHFQQVADESASPSLVSDAMIKSDKSIVQPKSSLLADNPQKFINDFLKNELLARFEKGLSQSKKASPKNKYTTSMDFQLEHFEDFFLAA